MIDREKVMTALAICTGKCKCLGCWYGQNNPDFRCQEQLMTDALTLLREQEEIKINLNNILNEERQRLIMRSFLPKLRSMIEDINQFVDPNR